MPTHDFTLRFNRTEHTLSTGRMVTAVLNLTTTTLSACPAYSGLADFGLEKTLPLYFVDEKHLVGM